MHKKTKLCLAAGILLCALLAVFLIYFKNTKQEVTVFHSGGQSAQWCMGFGRQAIDVPEDSEQPLYIAGYNSGAKISGVLDLCCAQAVWMDTGDDGILLIGVDCVGLNRTTIQTIRQRLEDFCEETGCIAVNIYSTHTHAGVDTLGLWGPTLVDGKNDDYSANLIEAAVTAAKQAYENRTAGSLYMGYAETENMLRDSRDPQVYDPNLYQIRFEPDAGSAAAADDAASGATPDNSYADTGIRMFLYGAHAESLRSSNPFVSRDYPGVLGDLVEEATGDVCMYMPGAVGGLIMTKEFITPYTLNLELTGQMLAEYALSITPESEKELDPVLSFASAEFAAPLDNTGFLFYKFLGILDNDASRNYDSATGYELESEMALLKLGDTLFCLMPGEIFPELVWGGEYGDANPEGVNPEPLADIASAYGFDQLLVIGLANDELGYIVPPSDFLLNEDAPYLEKTMDYKGENHYEETNSVGPETANVIAEVFQRLCAALAEN